MGLEKILDDIERMDSSSIAQATGLAGMSKPAFHRRVAEHEA
ncbi:hypothetical protein [Paenibacillus medicaginis]|uniref:Uncharacterized protein n=1 Tax=Paenibacillus medicaginis TaxID=1470560 RepID=A0ABV5C4D3_9BACL